MEKKRNKRTLVIRPILPDTLTRSLYLASIRGLHEA